MSANSELRRFAKAKGVSLWQIAEALNISEPTMTRKLRRELPDDEKAKIRVIITQLAEQREQEVLKWKKQL